jgi:hypothetical protein
MMTKKWRGVAYVACARLNRNTYIFPVVNTFGKKELGRACVDGRIILK